MSRTRNSFRLGMIQDVDIAQQNPNSYRYALGGRIRFNESNNNLEGNSFAFVNDKGTHELLALSNDYRFVGLVEIQDELVTFSTNGINAEIGLVRITEATPVPTATYLTLYNDAYDPNGDKLNLSTLPQHVIESVVSIESEEIKRFYWVDGRNELRCANLELFFFNPAQRIPYSGTYPRHLSVHQFTAPCDITFGRIKYQERIEGELLTGAYQLFYQLITEDGHHSNVSPVTKAIVHHAELILPNNHHKTRMGASNVGSGYGIRFSVEGIDTRWSHIRVGYLFAANDSQAQEINFFARRPIIGSTMTFDLARNGGVAVTQDYLNATSQWSLNPATLAILNNKLFVGNLALPKQPEVILNNFGIAPTYRLMDADETLMPQFLNENDHITNSSPKNTTVSIQNFTGNNEIYNVKNDRTNYKGTQWSHLFDGWWRGVPVELGIVLFDRKGNPLFVQPLPAYTTPQQYENAHLTQVAQGRYQLRIMGLVVSGLRFRHEDLFDANGKLLVSGFSIVKMRRTNPIRFQGVVVPAVRGNDVFKRRNTNFFDQLLNDEEKDGKYLNYSTQSMPSFRNRFKPNYEPQDGKRYRSEPFTDLSEPYSNYAVGNQYHEPYTFTLHAPDVMVEEKFPAITDTHRLKAVAGVHAIPGTASFSELKPNTRQYYTKNYKTGGIQPQAETKLGSETRLSLGIYHAEFEKRYDQYDTDRKDEPNHYFHTITSAEVSSQNVFFANALATRSVIAKAKDWRHVDVFDPDTNNDCSMLVVNYLVPDGLNQGDTNLDAQQYDSIGHFQPITTAILAQTNRTFNQNGSVATYTFNGIELYGGGCYVNFVDFTRLYPYWVERGDLDYGVSHIVPLESKYNYAMRYGRHFAQNGTQAKSTLLEEDAKHLWNGIMRQQPEDWNLNRCVVNNRRINTYAPQPPNTTLRHRLPTGFMWSSPKVLNETDDSYRKMLPLNTGDVEGSLGAITAFGTLFNQLYVFQSDGFSRLRIDERAALADTTGKAIYLGTPQTFTGVDIINNSHGATVRGSTGKLQNALYFIDIKQAAFCRFSQEGFRVVSNDHGRHDTFASACRLVSSFPNQPVFVRIQGDAYHNDVYAHLDLPGAPYFTTVFNEDQNAFTEDTPFAPHVMGKLNRYLLSTQNGKLYLHHYGKRGHYYGTYHNTLLQFIVQGQPLAANYFDNLLIHCNAEGASRIVAVTVASHNPKGQVHTIDLSTDTRPRYLEGALRLPLREQTHLKAPVHCQAISVRLTILNDPDNVEMVISAADTDFRPSFKQ